MKNATQAATTTCKLHKKETALHFDQTGGAWCEQCQQRALLMDYGAANKYPEINVAGCSVWSGAGAWKVTIPRLNPVQIATTCASLKIGVQSLPETPEPVLEAQEVSAQGNAEKQPLSAFSEPLCMKCAREGTHEDLHGRLWCADHAPQNAHLAAWFRTVLEERNVTPSVYRIDQRYSDCAWYDAKQHATPASQALDYALQRDYWYLDLEWYTPELKKLFGKYPEEAKAWVEKLAEAKRKGDRNRAHYLAAEINATQRKQEQPESLERCFLCEKESDVFDKHGRAYCLSHAPEDVAEIADLPATLETNFQEPTQDEETVMIDVCSIDGLHGEAMYFSAESGEAICETCFNAGK